MTEPQPFDPIANLLAARSAQGIDLGLDRLHRVLSRLGDPHRRLGRVVHVAGTNAKGSTVALLRGIGEAAGLTVNVFTSPHLVFTAESVRLAGVLAPTPALSAWIERVAAAQAPDRLTAFEMLTVAALLAFAEQPADLILLEVGLGGTDDATNVLERPALSVITPVDFDHMAFLGDDLAAIAGKKAGIIKGGRPVVSARQRPEAQTVIEARAEAMGAPLIQMGVDFDAWRQGDRLLVQLEDRLLDLDLPALPGAHQIDNAGLAAMAALTLNDPHIDEAAISRGIASAVWPARFQRLIGGPLGAKAKAAGTDLWLDGGHNPHAARALAQTISELTARDGRPAVLILGLLANKDADGVLSAFEGLDIEVLAIPFAAEAASPPERLVAAARKLGIRAQACEGVEAALDLALTRPGPPHVVIGGSLYLAGEVLALSEETWPT